MTRPRPVFYEFFAGGGMVRAALDEAWECRFANDICPKKGASYRRNWSAEHLRVTDVNALTPADLPGRADLAWASFPCQDLSFAGKQQGLQGARSGTFWGFWRLMQGLAQEGRKPRMILLENVAGALTSHQGEDFRAIAGALADAGYRFGPMIVDAVHFLPQSRPRLFALGVDAAMSVPPGLVCDRPQPAWHTAATLSAYNRLSDALRDAWLWWNPPAPAPRTQVLADLIEPAPEGVAWHSAAQTQTLLQMMDEVNRRKVRAAQQAGAPRVGTLYRRTRAGVQRAEVRFDGVAGCLRTPAGGSSRQVILVVEGSKIRSRLLSPREGARLMGLPESYELPKNYNESYHLTGDGVAVPVVKHLADGLCRPILAANAGETMTAQDPSEIRAIA